MADDWESATNLEQSIRNLSIANSDDNNTTKTNISTTSHALDDAAVDEDWTESTKVGRPTPSNKKPIYDLPRAELPMDDEVLQTSLETPREKMTLLKLEDDIMRFLAKGDERTCELSDLGSYQRLIVHRLAERCGLDRIQEDSLESTRSILLVKTQSSVIPTNLFIDVSNARQAQVMNTTSSAAPKIMMKRRPNNASKTAAAAKGSKSVKKNNISTGSRANDSPKKNSEDNMADRERAYAEARARIFGQEENSTASTGSVLSSVNKSLAKQAAGPDGSKGFTAKSSATTTVNSGGSISSNTSSSLRKNPETKPSDRSSGNWNEHRAVLRNREIELNDPDFARGYSRYNLNYAPYRVVDPQQAAMVPPPANTTAASYHYTQPPPLPNTRTGGGPRPANKTSNNTVLPNASYNADFPPLG